MRQSNVLNVVKRCMMVGCSFKSMGPLDHLDRPASKVAGPSGESIREGLPGVGLREKRPMLILFEDSGA